MYQAVIFDLDGTLLNTIDDLANAGNFVCQQNHWPPHSIEEYKLFVGNGIPKLVERFSPADQRTPERLAKTLEQFREYYALHKEDSTAPYEGIISLLAELSQKGIILGVLTNKEDIFAKQIIARYFDASVFQLVQGALPHIPPKPDPTALLTMTHHTAFERKNILFVGDSNVDILTAKNAGIDCCGVLWGFRSKEELQQAGATYLIQTPQELTSLICTSTL